MNERHPAAANAHRDEILARVITRQLRILRLQLELLEEARGARAGAPAPEEALTAPTTEAQHGLWALAQLDPRASAAYNQTLIMRLSGPIDVPALRRSLHHLVSRHEALRTTFDEDGRTQRIAPEGTAHITLIDLSDVPGSEATAISLLATMSRWPFDLLRGPLLRVALARLAGELSFLAIVVHHIVSDGRSLGVLLEELPAIYRSERCGIPCGLPEPVPFRDFRRLLAPASRPDEAAERFWQHKLEPLPPPLELPCDHRRPPLQTYRGARAATDLAESLVSCLRDECTAARATLFMALLAAFEVLLHGMTGQSDLVIGVHSARRATDVGRHLFGLAIQTLPLRLTVNPDTSFRDKVHATRRELLQAIEHDNVHIGKLIRKLGIARDPSRPPLISVSFNLELAAAELDWDGVRAEMIPEPSPPARYDVSWNLVGVGDTLRVDCTYNADLFDSSTAYSWLADFRTILETVATDPDITIRQVTQRIADEARARATREKALRSKKLQLARRQPVYI